jgi:hypothetical protein
MLLLRRLLPGLALTCLAVRAAAFTAVDFSGSANPWPATSFYTYGGGTITASTTWDDHGTIDVAGGLTPSPGLRLSVNASAATGSWGAALTSGRLAPPLYGTTDPRLITLAFMLKASDARPVLLRLESFNSSGARTGRVETLLHPAAPDFWQRHALELSDFTPLDGTFDPAAHRLQLILEIGSYSAVGNWPSAADHWLQLDNVHLAGPAYYVRPASDGGSDSANGRSPQTALATIQRALNLAQPGDTVLLLGGDYHPAPLSSEVARFPRPGTPAAWITLKNHPGHTPVLRPTGWQGLRIRRGDRDSPAPATQPALAYLEIRGLTIRGLSDTLPEASRGTDTGASNTGGISIDGRYDANLPHHIRVAGNHISWCAGGGVSAIQSDWIWVENNFVHDNCHWTIYAGSGISLYQATNYDGTSGGYRYLVLGNRTFRNETKIRWIDTGDFSDGNGVIIDDSRNTQNRDKNPFPRDASTGRFLVAHNLAHDNGGSGLHAFLSDRVDFAHNTVWQNSRSPHLRYRSLFANNSADVRFLNNLVVASPDKPLAGAINQSQNVVLSGNLFVGGDTPLDTVGVVTNTQNLFSAPLLSAPARGDLRLLSGSPALASALATPLAGARATLRSARDRGAWSELVPLAADSPFAAWSAVRGTTVIDPAADPDADSLPNLLEYALDRDPLAPATSPPLTTSTSDLKLQLTFVRSRTDVIYTVEASSTLAPDSWQVIATDPGTAGAEVTVTDPEPASPRRFLRLRVTPR